MCLEIGETKRLRDEEAIEKIKRKCEIKSGTELQNVEHKKRDMLIQELKKEGLSTRQLERLTGISRAAILKA
jgi:hypothetical protein